MIFTLAQQFSTLLGLLTIVPTGHGAVCLKLEDKIIYIDPYSQTTDYAGYPKADIIFFTHDHYDHYDTTALKHLVTAETV
ncbi:MAG TPA: MBL fold metallo-hydrolase, partial [Bacteroidales bacterium]|nr:MBL fold metallo-hydrolase [Bacteroidales bacterium]